MRAQQRLSQAFQNCLDSLLDRSRAYTLAVRRIESLVSAGLGQEAMIAARQLLVEHLPITIEREDHDELG